MEEAGSKKVGGPKEGHVGGLKEDYGFARVVRRSLPQLLIFNGAISLPAALLLGILDYASRILLSSEGTALTTANAAQVLLSWQGMLLAIVTTVVVVCYVAVEVFAHVYFCEALLAGEPGSLLARAVHSMRRALESLPRFRTPAGVSIFVYIVVLAPLVGVGFSTGLTRDLYVPHFIMSVIERTPVYLAAYTVVIMALAVVGLLHIFAIHYVLLGGASPRQALRKSRQLVRSHFGDLLKAALKLVFVVGALLVVAGVSLMAVYIALESLGQGYAPGAEGAMVYAAVDLEPTQELIAVSAYRSLCFFVSVVALGLVAIGGLLTGSCTMMYVTHLYNWFGGKPAEGERSSAEEMRNHAEGESSSAEESLRPAKEPRSSAEEPCNPAKEPRYSAEESPHPAKEPRYSTLPKKVRIWVAAPCIAFALVMVGIVSFICGFTFDGWMQREAPVNVVAHRLGGAGAPENSAEGLKFAIGEGCYGAETDIQRTADGDYVINHDDNFSRLCGSDAKSQDMTLEEVKRLRIRDPLFPDTEVEVPTLEELLEEAKGRIKLFVEFKGETADQQMVDDAVRIVREHGAEEDVVFISLKYDCIEYGEQTYPELDFGLLIFAGFGDMKLLKCDIVLTEEEMTTDDFIGSAHEAGKDVGVWTANTEEDLRKVLHSDADYVITDKVVFARDVQEALDARTDCEVIFDLVWG